ncbi:glycosyltransferase family 2 protein [Candidatus Roizmanbacteria bacterium]|nr:glycosyltransferase family 2 protein [Candidatus Roizmanbacteria bacterium]
MMNITAIIVVKQKPPHFFEALRSIEDIVSEIIVGTITIDEQYKKKLLENKKVRIIELPSDVSFADLVKEELKKKAKGEYILYLDPDEIFPTEIKKYIASHLKDFDYYLFPRKNIIFGKWISHSRWWPDYQLRLFKKNSVVWPQVLHPIPEGRGKGFRFEPEEKNAILHYNYNSIDEYIEKATRYAKSEAQELIQQNKKYSIEAAIKQALSEFISRFFAHEGYRDGMHGFVLSLLQKIYYFLVYFYYWEQKKYFEDEQKKLVKYSQNFFRQGLKEVNFWLVKKNFVDTVEKIRLKIIDKLF